MVSTTRRRRGAVLVAGAAVAAVLLASGCTKSSSPSSSGTGAKAGNATGGAQQTVGGAAAGASGCTYTKYGAPKLDLKTATIGFSQSESTSNPFRDTETKSIVAEAKAMGVKLIQRNANGNVSQQNTDIEGMIAQGAKALIVAPENAGVAPALAQAKTKHIPVITIDRTVNGTACSDFVTSSGRTSSARPRSRPTTSARR